MASPNEPGAVRRRVPTPAEAEAALARVRAGRNPEYREGGRRRDSFAAEDMAIRFEAVFEHIKDVSYTVARIALSDDGPAERQQQLEALIAELSTEGEGSYSR